MADRTGLLEALRERGFFVTSRSSFSWAADESPWELAARIAGGPVRMVERQRIRSVPGGRSFASTNVETPLHNDLQLYLGRPADLQIMACVRPAARGGDSRVLDMWPLLVSLATRDPELFDALFDVPRTFPFVAGPVESPTVALFEDRLVFLHTPREVPGDAIAARVRDKIVSQTPHSVRIDAGEILVVDNHRALHGRSAFTGEDRDFVRLLVWLREPGPARTAPSELCARARRSGQQPRVVPIDEDAERKLELVLRMAAGASPGALARESGRPEPELYALRDAALGAALEALGRRST